ncbi:MAG TPA: hypothetical protein VJL10_07490 [Anaerolineales bacterium]|nr:hypothetical protein [Anaerolineales bacterium]
MNSSNFLLFVSSLVSAGIASYITYTLARRSTKYEFLLKEKIDALKSIQQRLVSLKKYCYSVIAEYEGNEFAPRYEKDNKGALVHRDELSSCAEDNAIFFSEELTKKLNDLDSQLSLLCNFELWRVSCTLEERAAYENMSGYEGTIRAVDRCLADVQKELSF